MEFFVFKNDEQVGPFSLMDVRERLRSGTFAYEDLAWREGMADWTPLREILGGALPDATPHQVATVTLPRTQRLVTAIVVFVAAFAVIAAAAWLAASFVYAVSVAAHAALSQPGTGSYVEAGKSASLREFPIIAAGAAMFSLVVSPVVAWMMAYSNLFPWCRAR